MAGIETFMSIVKVEGEVMLHDGKSGWARAHAGMVFPSHAEITIKTGSSGKAAIINARGELVNLPGNSMKLLSSSFSADDVETLRQITISARDMMSARSVFRRQLSPAA